jgi:hypothetical protein
MKKVLFKQILIMVLILSLGLFTSHTHPYGHNHVHDADRCMLCHILNSGFVNSEIPYCFQLVIILLLFLPYETIAEDVIINANFLRAPPTWCVLN